MNKQAVTILVIDDNELVLSELVQLIQEELPSRIQSEVKVFSESNARNAISKISNLKPQVIVSDYFMAESNGYEVFNQAKSVLPSTSFIFISGYQKR